MNGMPNVGTTIVECRIGRMFVPATRYTARIGREVLMRKDGRPRTFLTRKAALSAAKQYFEAKSTWTSPKGGDSVSTAL